MDEAKKEERCCQLVSLGPATNVLSVSPTGVATMRSMRTKDHATTKVSTELEKVCVWYTQVT